MTTTEPLPDTMTTVDALDEDLRAACVDRNQAWRELVIKDTPAHRGAYDDACDQVDGLLDMRYAALMVEAT